MLSRNDKLETILLHLGYEIRHDFLGFYACTIAEAEYEDKGNASVGFDGRSHYQTIAQAAQAQVRSHGYD